MKKNYKFISDPGHGWLEVPLVEIRSLMILHQISKYSYIAGRMAYLEEDCDAQKFVQACKKEGIEVTFTEVYQDPTPIRSYLPFDERGIPYGRGY